MMAAPLWVGRFLPLLDLPQHLAIATILLRHGDPAWQLAASFEPQPGELTPYWAHYLALQWLGHLMPVDVAARVFLTLYVVALPWATMALSRALGRAPALGLLAAPLALNANLYYGFVAYCWSVVLLLWALALLARQLDAPRAGRAAGLGLLAGALFFTHVQSFAFLLLAAAVLAWCGAAPAWRRILRTWPLAPATLLLFVPWLYVSTTMRPGVDRYFAPLDDPRPKYEAPLRRVSGFPGAIAGSYQDRSDDWLLAAWAIVAAAAVLAARREAAESSAAPVVGLTAAALTCYFVLPVAIQGQWNIAQRFAWTAALLVPLLARRSPRWLPAATLALAAATACNAAWHHARFDREAEGFDGALASLPQGARVLGLIYDSRGKIMERWPYLHFEQYAIVHGGGYAAHSFAANAPLPVRLRPGARVPAPSVWRPYEFRYDEHARFFDHFLIRDPEGAHDGSQLFGDAAEEVFREGAWRVYRDRSDIKRMNGG